MLSKSFLSKIKNSIYSYVQVNFLEKHWIYKILLKFLNLSQQKKYKWNGNTKRN